MRKLIVSCNITVDGFIAGPDGSLDFTVPDSGQEDDLAARFGSVADTIVLGRQTFLEMQGYWPTVASDMASWLNTTRKVVLSRDGSFDVGGWENSTLAVGDGEDQVRRLKDSSGGDLVAFGGVATLRSLVAAGLVDEYWLKVSPIVLGQGLSMFSDIEAPGALALRSAQAFSSGMVESTYTT